VDEFVIGGGQEAPFGWLRQRRVSRATQSGSVDDPKAEVKEQYDSQFRASDAAGD
jgi:hypothetical protein